MSKKKNKSTTSPKTKTKSTFPWKIILMGVIIGVLVGAWGLLQPHKKRVPDHFPFGAADYCKQLPEYIKTYHLRQPLYIDLSQTRARGLAIVEASKNGKVFQLPTWDDAGALGPYAMDEHGNIYAAPVPYVSIDQFKPEDQSKIYKVDTKSGKMEVFKELPVQHPSDASNPFNFLGLSYDCDTKSLYASTVNGSDFENERGRILQIDVHSGKILDKKEGIDAIGLAVFNDKVAKYLYYGSARTSDIYRIKLGPAGEITASEPEFVLSLSAVQGGSTDKCHRIRFFKGGVMELKGIDFNYTLHAESDVRRNIYRFKYNPNNGKWDFVSVQRQKR